MGFFEKNQRTFTAEIAKKGRYGREENRRSFLRRPSSTLNLSQKRNPASFEAGFLFESATPLEEELQAELHNTSEVSTADLSKSGATGPNAGTGIGTGLASHRVGPAGSVVNVELRMVEDVEGFRTELKRSAFFDRKVLEDSHIEVQARRIADDVSARASEGEPLRYGKSARIKGKLGLAR